MKPNASVLFQRWATLRTPQSIGRGLCSEPAVESHRQDFVDRMKMVGKSLTGSYISIISPVTKQVRKESGLTSEGTGLSGVEAAANKAHVRRREVIG